MILLLALLCAAPERVVVVAKPAEKPGLFEKLGKALSGAARRLYQKDDPDVAKGNALAAEGDPEGALKEYDKARQRLPESAPLSLDRAGALLKMDAAKAPEAASEAAQALQHGEGSLKAQAAYDLALATEQMGRPEEAIKGYATALGLDPDDADSKVNLELLLKSEEERKQMQQQQQQQSKDQQQQQKQQPDKSKGDQQQKSQSKEAGDQKQEQKEQQQQAGQQQQKPDPKKQQQAEAQKPVDRSEAERLLDALRAGEKNLQAWRFAKDKRKEARRSEVEKDW